MFYSDLIRDSSQTREKRTNSSLDTTQKLATKGQLANEACSPGNEFNNFHNLVEDYLENGRSFSESSTAPKLNTVLDNNYDDNVDGAQNRNFAKSEPRRKFDSDSEKKPAYSSDTSRDGHIGFNARKQTDRRQPREDRRSQNGYNVDTNYSRKNAQSRIEKSRSSDGRRTSDECFTPQVREIFYTQRYRVVGCTNARIGCALVQHRW